MAILTKNKILEEIKKGIIKIEPFSHEAVGAGSVDLTLSDVFRIFKRQDENFKISEDANFRKITEIKVVEKGKTLLLKPGETILGATIEKISLPADICGWIEGRSRFARVGLGVHVSAGFIQPGSSNHQVLEITNVGPTPLVLIPGVKICQIVFERCEGKSVYRGKFRSQIKP